MELSELKIAEFLQNHKEDVLLCYILWVSLPVDIQTKFKEQFAPYVACVKSEHRRRMKYRKEVFYVRPALEVLNDFLNFKKPFSARWELRERLPYLSLDEQYAIISAFVDRDRSNRKWGLDYISEHWNNKFKDIVKKSFENYHELLAAEIICQHFDVKYISKHAVQLAKVSSYYNVRKRLPKDAPIDKGELYGNQYLKLAAELSLEISDNEVVEQLKKILLDSGRWYFDKCECEEYKSLFEIYGVKQTIYAIAKLKRPHIIDWFANINEATKGMLARKDIETYNSFIEEQNQKAVFLSKFKTK